MKSDHLGNGIGK